MSYSQDYKKGFKDGWMFRREEEMRDFVEREQAEKNAIIIGKNRKAADIRQWEEKAMWDKYEREQEKYG